MRLLKKSCRSLLALICITALCLYAAGPIYDPLDLPDPPWPDDPPDMFSDPFDPITDLPLPSEFDFPPEDPFDEPFPDFPDFPDPPGLDDPFPDLPSLDSGEQLGYLPWLGNSVAPNFFSKNHAAATNVLTKLTPFPMRLPFHPAPSGVNAARTRRVCSAATATKMIVPESKRSSVAFVETCPYRVTKRVTVGRAPIAVAGTPDGQFALVANSGSASISILDIASATVVATIPLPNFLGAPRAAHQHRHPPRWLPRLRLEP